MQCAKKAESERSEVGSEKGRHVTLSTTDSANNMAQNNNGAFVDHFRFRLYGLKVLIRLFYLADNATHSYTHSHSHRHTLVHRLTFNAFGLVRGIFLSIYSAIVVVVALFAACCFTAEI